MKVELKNVGMLNEAEFEVSDLTIICGENNTGKTYATYSLYGYLDFVRGMDYIIFTLFKKAISKKLKNIDIIDEYKIRANLGDIYVIFTDLFDEFEQKYKTNLAPILAGRENDFAHSEFHTDSKSAIMKCIKIDDKDKEEVKRFFSHSSQFELLEITEQYLVVSFEKNENQLNEKMQKDIEYRKETFVFMLLDYIISIFYPKAFILSAERTGASMFQRELDINRNEIVEKISATANTKNIRRTLIDVLNSKYSRYPKPVKDNIYFIRDCAEAVKTNSFISRENLPLHNEIIELLYKIVGGKYIVSEAGVEFAPGARKRVTKGKFSLQCSSSSVRSLLMLNLYILNIAKKGDILMIDEPELNLHPNNQILMGRLLALLVNAGVKVFITTHSDYIVRELSNCIMLNSLNDEQITKLSKKTSYTKEYKLEASKVKAYIAENVKGKNMLNPVNIDATRGIFMKTFDSPIDTQNENQSLIFKEIINAKDKDDK